MHYLVVGSNEPAVSFIIAAEGRGGIEACIVSSGELDIDPAGLALTIVDLFADP